MKLNLSHEIQAYQVYREAIRLDPDDEQLQEDCEKAKVQMEVAWLQHIGTTDER